MRQDLHPTSCIGSQIFSIASKMFPIDINNMKV